jgi:hypothetical protein
LKPALAATLCLLLPNGLVAGCGERAYEETRPPLRAFRVAFTGDTARGTAADPLPFPSAVPARVTLALTAGGKRLASYNGRAVVSVVPGEIDATQRRVQFVNGVPASPVTVELRFSYGETNVWVEDLGEDVLTECDNGLDDDGDGLKDLADPDCQRASSPVSAKATLATGISDALFFAEPRIRDLQFSPRCTTDTPLGGQNVNIDTGTLICTGTTQSGLYVTDLAGGPEGYNSVFLFTFSNPGGVKRGDRLCSIAGNAAEFIANTQLNFPSYQNARADRRAILEGQTYVPCNPPEPERTGEGAMPLPHVLTADDVNGTAAVVPPDFYRVCGLGDTPIEGLEDPTDCEAARQATRDIPREQQLIDCRRDNFAMEPWEHALVAIEDVTIGNRFENCDVNGDGSISRGEGDPEGACDEECGLDPLCTNLLSLEQYGQFAAGLGCTDAPPAAGADAGPSDADAGAGDAPAAAATCAAKVYISTRDTLGKSGYDVRKHEGEKLARIVGHLRQTQPGAGVQTIWVIEPRAPEDFVSGVTP